MIVDRLLINYDLGDETHDYLGISIVDTSTWNIRKRIICTDNPDPNSWIRKFFDFNNETMRFKQAIRIGDNSTVILSLPCVAGYYKYPISDQSGKFPLRGHIPSKGEIIYHFRQGGIDDFAMFGDWLCEDCNGVWHILSNEEYEKHKETL